MLMKQDLETIRKQIYESVFEILEPEQKQNKIFELRTATETITDHVLKDVPQLTDADRYDWFYRNLGMAVNIARGWKQTTLKDLKESRQTSDNLQLYIEKTYGLDFKN